jgi:hypothetical protein
VLQTRPHGVPRTAGSRLGETLVEQHLRRLNPELAAVWRGRAATYEQLVDDIGRRSRSPDGAPPYVLGLRPPAGTPVVSQLERRAEVLAPAAAGGQRLVEDALGYTAPAAVAP